MFQEGITSFVIRLIIWTAIGVGISYYKTYKVD